MILLLVAFRIEGEHEDTHTNAFPTATASKAPTG
jgi:hypothetical protein